MTFLPVNSQFLEVKVKFPKGRYTSAMIGNRYHSQLYMGHCREKKAQFTKIKVTNL